MRRKRLKKLIEAVEAFPDGNFNMKLYKSGHKRCAGGIAFDRFKKLNRIYGVPFLGLREFFELDSQTSNFLFGVQACNKQAWLERADYVLNRRRN